MVCQRNAILDNYWRKVFLLATMNGFCGNYNLVLLYDKKLLRQPAGTGTMPVRKTNRRRMFTGKTEDSRLPLTCKDRRECLSLQAK